MENIKLTHHDETKKRAHDSQIVRAKENLKLGHVGSSYRKPFQLTLVMLNIISTKKEDKDQESIHSSTTPDPGYQWESDNFTVKHHKREPRGQLFHSRWPKVSRNRQHENITKQDRNNINDPQKKRCLRTVSKNILLEGLNRFHGAPTSPLV